MSSETADRQISVNLPSDADELRLFEAACKVNGTTMNDVFRKTIAGEIAKAAFLPPRTGQCDRYDCFGLCGYCQDWKMKPRNLWPLPPPPPLNTGTYIVRLAVHNMFGQHGPERHFGLHGVEINNLVKEINELLPPGYVILQRGAPDANKVESDGLFNGYPATINNDDPVFKETCDIWEQLDDKGLVGQRSDLTSILNEDLTSILGDRRVRGWSGPDFSLLKRH